MTQECKVVFLDRDGVINKKPPVHQYVSSREEMTVLPGVADAIRRLNDAGLFVFVVSNQRGVQRGLLTMDDLKDVHDYLDEILEKKGAHIDGYYICPHGNNECECRKPKPGLLYKAEEWLKSQGYTIDKDHSCMIGDSDTDIEAGKAYGVNTIKIGDKESEEATLLLAVDKYFSDIHY